MESMESMDSIILQMFLDFYLKPSNDSLQTECIKTIIPHMSFSDQMIIYNHPKIKKFWSIKFLTKSKPSVRTIKIVKDMVCRIRMCFREGNDKDWEDISVFAHSSVFENIVILIPNCYHSTFGIECSDVDMIISLCIQFWNTEKIHSSHNFFWLQLHL